MNAAGPSSYICMLEARRQERGLTQRGLADRVGVSHASIGRYERGVDVPRLDVALLIAAILGVGLDDLYVPARTGRGA